MINTYRAILTSTPIQNLAILTPKLKPSTSPIDPPFIRLEESLFNSDNMPE